MKQLSDREKRQALRLFIALRDRRREDSFAFHRLSNVLGCSDVAIAGALATSGEDEDAFAALLRRTGHDAGRVPDADLVELLRSRMYSRGKHDRNI